MDEIEFMDKVNNLTKQFANDMTKTRKESKYNLHLSHDELAILNMILNQQPKDIIGTESTFDELSIRIPTMFLVGISNLARRVNKLYQDD